MHVRKKHIEKIDVLRLVNRNMQSFSSAVG